MDIIELLKVIFLGIVEGITEWLPISSTGHMILVDEFIHLNVSQDFMDVFLVVIQLGAILAVVVLYWNKLWPFYIKKLPRRTQMAIAKKPKWAQVILNFVERFCDKEKWVLWFKIVVACLPTIVIALPFDDFIEEHFNNYVVVAIALIVYGVLFIVVENYNKGREPQCTSLEDLSFKTAFLIGCFQVLSVIPGTSRSGSTIIGGILVGTSRTVAAEFTFFLGIPVMFGASLLKILKFGFSFTGTEVLILVVGMVVAFVVSILAIKFLMGYIKKHDFKAFGWYRIVLGALVLVYFTEIQLLDSVRLDKNKMLPERSQYSYQLKNYLENEEGLTNRTCFVYFSNSRKKLQKTINKMKIKYQKGKTLLIREVNPNAFKFKKPEE